ncbi:UNVERIFIED_CONTAM: hypothetical protein RKD50_000368 [Streptomyces canus]
MGSDLLGVGMISGRVVHFGSSHGYAFTPPDGGGDCTYPCVNGIRISDSYAPLGPPSVFERASGEREPRA